MTRGDILLSMAKANPDDLWKVLPKLQRRPKRAPVESRRRGSGVSPLPGSIGDILSGRAPATNPKDDLTVQDHEELQALFRGDDSDTGSREDLRDVFKQLQLKGDK